MAASGFGHLGLDERRSLFRLREARVPIAEIASRLGRHRSTIYRELRIASPEMLPTGDLLPHVICSPPAFAGGGEHEADQHDDA